jgi:hypothetical protein
MPNAWIPLELEIAELTAAGKQILPLKEIDALNNDSEVSIQNFYLWIVFIHCINKHTMLQNQVISTFAVTDFIVCFCVSVSLIAFILIFMQMHLSINISKNKNYNR